MALFFQFLVGHALGDYVLHILCKFAYVYVIYQGLV